MGLDFISDMWALLGPEVFPTAEWFVMQLTVCSFLVYRSHLHEYRGYHFNTIVLMPLLSHLAPTLTYNPPITLLLFSPDD